MARGSMGLYESSPGSTELDTGRLLLKFQDPVQN